MIKHPVIEAVSHNLSAFFNGFSCRFLLTCSGGADSTALLTVFHHLQSLHSYSFSVLSVNHNVRSAEESAADAQFVADLCKTLTPAVPCYIEELPRNAVTCCAEVRKRGIEDAARVLRYRVFEKYAKKLHADFIVTAHNKNDVYETLLMRMFQGGGTHTLQKMPIRRGWYLRPLSTVSRSEIEAFLRRQNISWREDATNNENQYLRNRIRHFLIPALEQTFGTWHSGFDKTLQRIGFDRTFCDTALTEAQTAIAIKETSYSENSRNGADDITEWQLCKTQAVCISKNFFYSLPTALRLRLLEAGCTKLMISERIPLPLLLRLANIPIKTAVHDAGSLRFEQRDDRLFLFNKDAYNALYYQKDYTVSVTGSGLYSYPLGTFSVYKKDSAYFIKDSTELGSGIGPLTCPFYIRGRKNGDKIKMSNGHFKYVKKIFNEWGVDSLARELLPVIIEGDQLRALYGSPLKYKNWIVQQAK